MELNEEITGYKIEYSGPSTIASCILKLPARYREVILLKYHHGYSLKEIAKMLEISESNAIKLDQRGKKKLEQLCKEEGLL